MYRQPMRRQQPRKPFPDTFMGRLQNRFFGDAKAAEASWTFLSHAALFASTVTMIVVTGESFAMTPLDTKVFSEPQQ